MDGESAGIDAQSHRIVDKRERDKGKQGGYDKKADAYLGERIVHLFYQVVLITYFRHARVAFQFLGYPLQGIIVGIIRLCRDFDRWLERVHTGKFARIGTQIVGSLLQSLFLGDIGQTFHVRTCLQALTHLQALRIGNILLQHHLYHQVLLDIGREVSSHQYGKDDQSQQNKHHGGADA